MTRCINDDLDRNNRKTRAKRIGVDPDPRRVEKQLYETSFGSKFAADISDRRSWPSSQNITFGASKTNPREKKEEIGTRSYPKSSHVQLLAV